MTEAQNIDNEVKKAVVQWTLRDIMRWITIFSTSILACTQSCKYERAEFKLEKAEEANASLVRTLQSIQNQSDENARRLEALNTHITNQIFLNNSKITTLLNATNGDDVVEENLVHAKELYKQNAKFHRTLRVSSKYPDSPTAGMLEIVPTKLLTFDTPMVRKIREGQKEIGNPLEIPLGSIAELPDGRIVVPQANKPTSVRILTIDKDGNPQVDEVYGELQTQ